MNDAIRLTDLRVRYGRVRALDGLSLAVSATNLGDRREEVCTDGYCYFGQGRTVLGSLKYRW